MMLPDDTGILLLVLFFLFFLLFKWSTWPSQGRRQGAPQLGSDIYLLLLVFNFHVPSVVNVRE